jgi:hypothetical protein
MNTIRIVYAFLVVVILIAVSDSVAQLEPCRMATRATPRPLDLVADRGFDLNGIALNPRWGYQTSPNLVCDPQQLCNPNQLSSCTTQSLEFDLPGLGESFQCGRAANPLPGHTHWGPATYTGTIVWFEKSNPIGDDDDYTMDLLTPDQYGALRGDNGNVHLEFSSDETIDHFTTAWWSDVHEAVDVSDGQGFLKITARGGHASATGMMGIDWVHQNGAELHPVWALAIQNSSGWAFFVRNWGNEGYCSSHKHTFDSPTYTFTLPWEFSYGAAGQKIPATDVSILPAEIHVYGIPFPQAQVTIYKVQNEGVVVIFRLPPPPQFGPGHSDGPFYEGQINLQWQFAPGTNSPPPPPPPHGDPKCNKVPPPPSCEEKSAEREEVEDLLGMLSDSQKAVIAAKLKPPPWTGLTTILSQNAIHVDRLDHLPSPAASRPTTRAIFDEKKAGRDKIQLDQLCEAFHGTIPHFPKACLRSSPDR